MISKKNNTNPSSRPVRAREKGLSLLELVAVFFILAILLGLALPNVYESIRRARLDADVAQFARTLRGAAQRAMLLGNEMEIVIDVTDGYYSVYEIRQEQTPAANPQTESPPGLDELPGEMEPNFPADPTLDFDSEQPLADELPPEQSESDFSVGQQENSGKVRVQLVRNRGLDLCYIEQVLFDDGGKQYSGQVVLYVSPTGWENSVVFDLIDDRDQRMRYVRCDRRSARVFSSNKPLDLPEPRKEVSMTSPL